MNNIVNLVKELVTGNLTAYEPLVDVLQEEGRIEDVNYLRVCVTDLYLGIREEQTTPEYLPVLNVDVTTELPEGGLVVSEVFVNDGDVKGYTTPKLTEGGKRRVWHRFVRKVTQRFALDLLPIPQVMGVIENAITLPMMNELGETFIRRNYNSGK